MKKTLSLSMMIMLLSLTLSAQNQTVTDVSEIENIITLFSENINNIDNMLCHYQYEKSVSMLEETIQSSGTVAYMKKCKLYWNSENNNSSFLLINDSIKIVNKDNCNVTTTENHPLFKEIAKIVSSGEENGFVFDKNTFETVFSKDTDAVTVQMTPKKKRLKSLFNSILIIIDNDTMTIQSIEITDVYGDMAKIILSDVVFNAPENERYFKF